MPDSLIIIILIIGIIVLVLLGIATLYLISTLRRRNIVLKKADYLIEDITYKSESLNVTVETINKLSNYALSLDTVSQNGLKSLLKFLSENRNYIYSIVERLRSDVENKEKTATKKKPTTVAKKSTTKKTTKKPASTKKTSEKKTTTKKPLEKKPKATKKSTNKSTPNKQTTKKPTVKK